jgi:dephospho-CoA kinase
VENDFDLVVVVLAPPGRVLENIAKRDGLDEDRILDRFLSQIPPEEKARRAKVVIQNNGTIEDLRLKAKEFWNVYVNF